MHSTSDVVTQKTELPVVVEQQGSLGHVRLNRPKALNSLTQDMVRMINAALSRFEHDPAVAAVLITGEGERGLCAGGDIRAMYDSGKAGDGVAANFWGEEYRLNARISHYPKPYIAFMDGIVMGGGVGVSVYGSYRIVTERTRLAMPETGIGFFPDIGASWFLTRTPGEGTTYLALTGEVIGAGDAIALGLADTYISASLLPDLIDALAAAPTDGGHAAISDVIARFATVTVEGPIAAQGAMIDRFFAFDRIEDILTALDRDGSEFALKTVATLRTRCPTSLKVTLRMLRLGRAASTLEECLERELAATGAVLASHDFYEGVRAAVIDKDRNPQWRPIGLSQVTDEQVATYFPAEGPKLFAG